MKMPTPASRHRRARGFTLIEMLCAVAIAGVVSGIAYPSYQQVVHKARRSDALVAVLQVQMAQERYRSDHARYASLAELRIAERSAAGHYRLVMVAHDDTGYELHAVAHGGQHADTTCRRLKLVVEGAQVTQASGRDERFVNTDAANRRCWGS
jgi:type IV pilus assembly protein PilE